MGGIPPELTSSALTALAIIGTYLGVVLARRGKKEDTRIARDNQSFTQLMAVSEERRRDNEALKADLAAERAENEKVRSSWEARWSRQMDRCRGVTDSLVRALAELQKNAVPTAESEAALRGAEQHQIDDHDSSTD